jgi:DNA-binding transcriptional regulator YdaS (Cro superfamily)
MSDTSNLPALARRVIEQIGGSAYLARILGLPKTTVQSWKGSRIPDVYAIRLARLSGLAPEEIRPDIFAPAAAAPAPHTPSSSDTDADADLVGSSSVVGPSS